MEESSSEPKLKAGTEDTGGDLDFMEFEESEMPAEGPSAGTVTGTSKTTRPSSSGLQAGFADDNKQYGYFIGFLSEYESAPHLPLDVSERIVLQTRDADGKSMANAEVEVRYKGRLLESGKTHADGSYLFFPSRYPSSYQSFEVQASAQQQTVSRTFERNGERKLSLRFESSRYIDRKSVV